MQTRGLATCHIRSLMRKNEGSSFPVSIDSRSVPYSRSNPVGHGAGLLLAISGSEFPQGVGKVCNLPSAPINLVAPSLPQIPLPLHNRWTNKVGSCCNGKGTPLYNENSKLVRQI